MDDRRSTDAGTAESAEDLTRLLESRRQIEGWLDRLDQQAGSASREIIEKVREDYRERLEEVTDEILRRQDLMSRWMAEAEERVEDATARRELAAGQLEEARLRHQIGEWDDERWERLRDEYQATIDEARNEEESASADIARLRELLGASAEPASTPGPERSIADSGSEEEDEADDFTVVAASPNSGPAHLPSQRTTPRRLDREGPPSAELGDEEESADESTDADEPTAPPADPQDSGSDEADEEDWGDAELPDDVTLVPETMSAAPDPTANAEDEFDPETVPKPGIKCGNCGYTNDATAWFCGVCGADIG